MGGISVWGRWGGGAGGGHGPACFAKLLRRRTQVFYCMWERPFFFLFFETKTNQVLNDALSKTLEHKSAPLSTYFFVGTR